MKGEMLDPGETLMAEIADKRMKRNDVALTYAFALRSPAGVDFRAVNRAILDRWSMAALKYIKKRAWRLYEGKADG